MPDLPPLTPDQQELARVNYPLALHAADHWAKYCPALRRLSRDDRIGAALLGLSEAARRFDPERGVSFSTYAMPWMRSTMQAAAVHGGVVSLPRDVLLGERELSTQRQRQAEAVWGTVSLDASPDGISLQERDLARWLSGEREQEGPDPEVETWLRRALARLPSRDREVLRLRFWEGKTLREAGEILGISGSRAQQLHNRIIERLRRGWRERERKRARRVG